MPSANNKIAQVISNNYEGLSVILNTAVSYVNLLQGRRDARQTFVCVQKVLNLQWFISFPLLIVSPSSPTGPCPRQTAKEDQVAENADLQRRR